MITNAKISQYSPNSEESDDQPLDFSKSSTSTVDIKRETNRHRARSTPSPEGRRSPPSAPTNCFTTPSPSPPEHNANNHHSNQVLCQLLTGNLIPTSTGKLMPPGMGPKNLNPLLMQNESAATRINGQTVPSPEALSAASPPNSSLLQVLNERHNSSRSPTGSASPIGLGPLNQVDMHFAQSPNATGVDRFGTSGGLLTTAPPGNVFAANDGAKRALKYSRPFKAYPRDPLSIPMNYYGVGLQVPLTADAIATQSLLATASDQAYLQFREQMLISRRNNQEPVRRNGQPERSSSQRGSAPSSPEPPPVNANGNTNGSNGNKAQNYVKACASPPSNPNPQLASKVNGSHGSVPPMTPISSSSQIHSDETLDYSNGHSSGNSSSGEADVGLMPSSANSGRRSADGHQSMRKRGRPLPEDLKDEAYWERRRKNNEAAKRSRDARRAKEDEIAIRAAFLEQENLKLRCEIAQLKTETAKLRCLLYNS